MKRAHPRAAWTRHADLVALVLLTGAAALPRLALLLRVPTFITNDSLSYLLPGFDLATGVGFEPIFKRPPGYSVLIAGSIWFFGGQNLIGLLALQHALGVLTVLLTYALASRLFGRAAGWTAGLLTAFSGPLIVTEHYLMSEALFGILLAATLLTTTLGLTGRRIGWIAAAGLLLGLAALTRPIAQILLPLLTGLCFLIWPRWQAPIRAATVLIGCYSIVVLPWMFRNAAVQQSFTLAGGLGEGLAVRTIRLDQNFDFGETSRRGHLERELRIYREEARRGSVVELAERLRTEAGLTPAQADQVMREIAIAAGLNKPLYYIVGSWDMFARMFAGRPVRLRQDWEPWRGIQWEERVVHLFPAATPEQEHQFAQTQAIVSIYDPARWPLLTIFLFLAGCVAALRRQTPRFRLRVNPEESARWITLLPAATAAYLLLASAFLVGIEWRYRFPLDPLINVTVGGGLAALTTELVALSRRRLPISMKGSALQGRP